jgi:hypothetical protein
MAKTIGTGSSTVSSEEAIGSIAVRSVQSMKARAFFVSLDEVKRNFVFGDQFVDS